MEFLQFWALFFFGMIFFFDFFLIFCSFDRFFFKTLPEPGFFCWNEVIFVFFGLPGGGGGFSQDFWIFWNSCSSGPFFFWNESFVFGIFGFSAVSSFFFQNLTRTRFFFGMRSFLFFLAFEKGGGFAQDFWIFWIFWNSCSFGCLFFRMKFLFLDFLDFLQFRAFFFCQNLTRTRVFFGMRSFCFFVGLRGGGVVSPRTFGFFGFFGIPAVLGPFFWNEIFLGGFFFDFLPFRAFLFLKTYASNQNLSCHCNTVGGGYISSDLASAICSVFCELSIPV